MQSLKASFYPTTELMKAFIPLEDESRFNGYIHRFHEQEDIPKSMLSQIFSWENFIKYTKYILDLIY